MGGVDDEFEDFLKRRKPVFRAPDDMFEPPAELDRVVLRQARDAIESEQPLRVFRGPRWATPLALAATLVLAFTVIFHAGMPQKRDPVPEVTVQNVAERVEIPEAAPVSSAPSVAANNQERADATSGDAIVVDLATPMAARRESAANAAPAASAERYAPTSPPAAPMAARKVADSAAGERGMASASAETSTVATAPPAATPAEVPPWRHDAKSWMAEIERLRKSGDTERADAEYAEFKRQQRAYAVGPDR